jgi:uncharacterized protein YbjT (DUF2867 family)
MSFVVAGVSGNTGKIVAESLIAQKRAVKVVVRDSAKGEPWRAKGADVAVADLSDADALARALRGAEGAYLLIPPTFAAPDFRAYQDRLGSSIAEALRASHVPHAVLLSSIGAQHASGTGPIVGLHRAEEQLRREARPSRSFERVTHGEPGSSLATLAQGFVSNFVPASLAIDMVPTIDIGRLAASLLLEGGKESQVVELGGPAVSMNDVAAALGRITGKPVRVEEAPLDAVVPAFTGFGMPKDLAELYREMLEAIMNGRVKFEGTHRRITATTSIETFLRGAREVKVVGLSGRLRSTAHAGGDLVCQRPLVADVAVLKCRVPPRAAPPWSQDCAAGHSMGSSSRRVCPAREPGDRCRRRGNASRRPARGALGPASGAAPHDPDEHQKTA